MYGVKRSRRKKFRQTYNTKQHNIKFYIKRQHNQQYAAVYIIVGNLTHCLSEQIIMCINSRDGTVFLVSQYQEHFTKYFDETLQLLLCLSTHIMEARVKLKEIYPKSEENYKLLSNNFIHLQTFIARTFHSNDFYSR